MDEWLNELWNKGTQVFDRWMDYEGKKQELNYDFKLAQLAAQLNQPAPYYSMTPSTPGGTSWSNPDTSNILFYVLVGGAVVAVFLALRK